MILIYTPDGLLVIMWKPLILIAVIAFYMRSSEATSPKCPINEIYEKCPAPCPPRECGVNIALILCAPSPKPGDPDCKPGCRCADGYLRNRAGDCILEDQCKYDCAKNETLDPCYSPCPPRYCGVNIAAVSCLATTECELGCRCSDGYLRNGQLFCVLEKDCPKCKKHERYDVCPAPCPPRRCDVDERSIRCAAPPNPGDPECKPGCRCDDGYVRNSKGLCVTRDQCPPRCGPNEVVSNCSNGGCGPWTCSDIGFTTGCVKMDPKYCKVGCVCKKGYVRSDGICIPINECPPVCGDNEVHSKCINGRCQAEYCFQLGKPIPCVKIDPEYCIKGCLCAEGYLRARNDNCVPEDQCDNCNKPHEHYDPCAKKCPPESCESIGREYDCPKPPLNCQGACRCDKGYFRNKIGECITKKQCMECRGVQEYFSCGSAYDNVCATLYKQNQTNCPIINAKCNPKCYCEKGYARDKNNICIPIKHCPASCGGNPDAVSSCGINCSRFCSNYNKRPVSCPKILCKLNSCNCKKYFVYNQNTNKCVCPKESPVCGDNEVHSECINGGCEAKNCSQLIKPIPCIKIDPEYCIKGCLCKEGYLRASNGVCVPQDQCDQCNKLNEHYDPCAPSCPPQTCESIGRQYDCLITAQYCRGACRCDKGYYRNKIGDCISKENCLKCTGPDEFFSCGGACDNVCATLNERNRTNCPIINFRCNDKCYCIDGYARNGSNICIPIKDCPEPRCGSNERFEESPSKVCEPQYCSELGLALDCPPVDDLDYEDTPACICKQGYVRDKRGNCILKSECRERAPTGAACMEFADDLVYLSTTNAPPVPYAPNLVTSFTNADVIGPTNTTTSSTVNVAEARARLDKGNIILAGEFLYQLVSSKPDENSVVSATSVMIPLAQLAIWTEKLVLEQLLKLLNLNNKDEIRGVFLDLTKSYAIQQNVQFEVANKCYANEGYPLSANSKRESKEYFDSEYENLDFEQNVQAAQTINDWVKNRTHGRIEELVSENMFSAATRLVIVNAMYFLGDWVHQFNAENTKTKDFYKRNGETVPVEMMYQKNYFNYAENENFQVLEMQYKRTNFSCLVILPRKVDGLLETTEFLRDLAEFSNILIAMKKEQVQVYLPKIKITTQSDMGEMLKKAHVTAMFDPDNDSIHGLLEKEEPLYVSQVVQKAFILIDEKGTEAAAASAVILKTKSLPLNPPKVYVFNANRPFLFYIRCQEMVLFCGAFVT